MDRKISVDMFHARYYFIENYMFYSDINFTNFVGKITQIFKKMI